MVDTDSIRNRNSTEMPAPAGAGSHDASLRLDGVTKRFGHIEALRGVSLTAQAGQILALVGDNGAGKSTLIKIMSGLLRPDDGEIRLGSQRMDFRTPSDARRAGLATVYQDLAMVECLDIATNMFLGDVLKKGPFVNKARMDRESLAFLRDLDVPISSVKREVGMLSGGQRQLIAIARTLRVGAKFILLDEPTAALGVRETSLVEAMIKRLTERDCAVILVSHDLDFAFRIADRFQVMRLGAVAGVCDKQKTTRDEIVGLITGSRDRVTP